MKAFTRVELLAVLLAVGLIGIVAAPVLAGGSAGSERAVCANNLRLIGRGLLEWVGSNKQHQPPWRVSLPEGGTYFNSRPANSFYEWSTISNEVVAPKVFACPSDSGATAAVDWANARYVLQQRAMSYTINADGRPGVRGYVSSDLNLRFESGVSSCSAGFNNINFVTPFMPSSSLQWTNAVHGDRGNVLFFDGSVEFTSTARLRETTFVSENNDAGVCHIIKAR